MDTAFSGRPAIFYRRYMDDWVIIVNTRRQLRQTSKGVYAVLKSLNIDKHPDKTWLGQAKRGFDFLGFRINPTTSSQPSAASVSRRKNKVTRLYEQGASKQRIGLYLRRWLGWALVPWLAYGPAYGDMVPHDYCGPIVITSSSSAGKLDSFAHAKFNTTTTTTDNPSGYYSTSTTFYATYSLYPGEWAKGASLCAVKVPSGGSVPVQPFELLSCESSAVNPKSSDPTASYYWFQTYSTFDSKNLAGENANKPYCAYKLVSDGTKWTNVSLFAGPATTSAPETLPEEAARRIPNVIQSVNLDAGSAAATTPITDSTTLTSGTEYTVTWTQLGYDPAMKGEARIYECEPTDTNCGGVNAASTQSSTPIAGTKTTGAWSYVKGGGSEQSSAIEYSWTFTPNCQAGGEVVLRFNQLNTADESNGLSGTSVLVPGGLLDAGLYGDTVGRRIKLTCNILRGDWSGAWDGYRRSPHQANV